MLRVCKPVPRAELGRISSFGREVLQMVFGASTLVEYARGGLYQGVILDIYHIYLVSYRWHHPLSADECNTLAL